MTIRRPNRSTVATVVASIFLVACGFGQSSQPQARPETREPAPATSAPAVTPGPARTTAKAKSGTLSSRTTAGTRQRVSCADIHTELKLVAQNGAVDWTSRAVDRWTPTSVGSPVSSVTVTPSSGTLASGASVVVEIRGSYPAGNEKFWVLFDYPTSIGPASVTLDVSC
jgi:hypothetical protein